MNHAAQTNTARLLKIIFVFVYHTMHVCIKYLKNTKLFLFIQSQVKGTENFAVALYTICSITPRYGGIDQPDGILPFFSIVTVLREPR